MVLLLRLGQRVTTDAGQQGLRQNHPTTGVALSRLPVLMITDCYR